MSLLCAALTCLNESQCTGEITTAHTAGQDTHSEVTMYTNAKQTTNRAGSYVLAHGCSGLYMRMWPSGSQVAPIDAHTENACISRADINTPRFQGQYTTPKRNNDRYNFTGSWTQGTAIEQRTPPFATGNLTLEMQTSW